MQDSQQTTDGVFPIGELSARSGINSVTLRAWERRYGLLKPLRSSKGHRLYRTEDVKHVQRILALIERGVPLRKIRPLLEGKESLASVQQDNDGLEWQQQLKDWLVQANQQALAQDLQVLFKQYPAFWCRTQVLEPLFAQLIGLPFQAALEALLQAEVMRYLARYMPAEKDKKIMAQWIIGGETTAAWRPALLALELTEKQPCFWLAAAFSLNALQQLLQLTPSRPVLYCLDGVLNAAQTAQLQQLLEEHPQLTLQGTAAELAFAGSERVLQLRLR